MTAYIGFVLIGMVATSFGPALPALGRAFHLGLAGQAGLLLAEALAYGVATFAGGTASDVLGRKRLFVGAAILTTMGMVGLAVAPSWSAMLATSVLAGAGAGMIDSLTNALFLDLTSGHEGSAGSMNLLHAFFGLGALIEPGIAAVVLGHNWSWRLLFVGPVLVGVVLVVASLATTFLPSVHEGGLKLRPMLGLLTRPAFLLLAGTLAIYSGAELVVTDWMVTYLVRQHLTDLDTAARVLSLFWFMLLLGRLLGTWVAAHIDAYWLTGGSAALSAITLLLAIGLPSFWSAALFFSLTGLCYAVLFPTTFAIAGRIYASYAGTLSGGLIVGAVAGSSLLPWLTGQIGQAEGLRAPLAGVAIITLLAVPALAAIKGSADARAAA